MSDEADIETGDEVGSALISPAMRKILDGMTPLTRRNRIELIQKVADGTAQLWQINLLKADGILALPEPLETNVSDDIICDTMELLAARMKKHYQNPDGTSRIDIDIDKGTISDWCNLRRLDAGQHPPPGTIGGTKRGKYSLKAWIAWFDQWMLPEKKANGARGAGVTVKKDSKQRREDAAARIAEAEADRIEKENNDKFTLTETAEKDGAGLGIAAINSARDILENELVPKVSIGLDAINPDEAARAALIEKIRRDSIELVSEFQKRYASRAREIIEDQGAN